MRGRNLVVAASLLMVSCGFHLRGSGVDADVASAYVRASQGVDIVTDLTRALRQSGVDILDDAAQAAVVIDLLEQQQSGRAVSFTDRATTAEYQLDLSVRFQILAADEKVLTPERWARATRTYLVDTNNLVGSDQQRRLLSGELGTDLAQQIVRALSAAMRTNRH